MPVGETAAAAADCGRPAVGFVTVAPAVFGLSGRSGLGFVITGLFFVVRLIRSSNMAKSFEFI